MPTRENPPRPLRASSTTGSLLQIVMSIHSPRGESSTDGGDIPAIAREMSRRVARLQITNAGAVPESETAISVATKAVAATPSVALAIVRRRPVTQAQACATFQAILGTSWAANVGAQERPRSTARHRRNRQGGVRQAIRTVIVPYNRLSKSRFFSCTPRFRGV